MRYDLVVRSLRAVLPGGEGPAALAVKDGRIAAVEPYDARLAAAREEDLTQTPLLPGLIDIHVCASDAGFAATAAAAAARG